MRSPTSHHKKSDIYLLRMNEEEWRSAEAQDRLREAECITRTSCAHVYSIKEWKEYCKFPLYTKAGRIDGCRLENLTDDHSMIDDDEVYELHIRMGGGAFLGPNHREDDRAPFLHRDAFKVWIHDNKDLSDMLIAYWIHEKKRAPPLTCGYGNLIFMFVVHVLGKNIDKVRNMLSAIPAVMIDGIMYGSVNTDSVGYSAKRRRMEKGGELTIALRGNK